MKQGFIKEYPNNAKKHTNKQIELIARSIQRFGWQQPIKVGKDGYIIVGHGRWLAYQRYKDELDLKEAWVIDESGRTISGAPETRKLSPDEERAYRIADNKINSLTEIDDNIVMPELDSLDNELFDITGYIRDEISKDNEKYHDYEIGALSERFIVSPFSILDTTSADWQDRKRRWISLGIESEIGRDDGLLGSGLRDMAKRMDGSRKLSGAMKSGTSVFDPVLCEVMYHWFVPRGGSVIDPFAGGSVRGVVAQHTGHDYHGIELRKEQVDANIAQADKIFKDKDKPKWIHDDAINIDKHFHKSIFDFIFTCPPYADLEVYSDDERDLSTMEYDVFLDKYKQIIHKALDTLKNNRFAVVVVGEVRDKKAGAYRNFVSDTIDAFVSGGAHYYNEIILVNAIGTLAISSNKIFTAGRKVGKRHQNILVFWKGDLPPNKSLKDDIWTI